MRHAVEIDVSLGVLLLAALVTWAMLACRPATKPEQAPKVPVAVSPVVPPPAPPIIEPPKPAPVSTIVASAQRQNLPSTQGEFSPIVESVAREHAEYQARIGTQGHQRWPERKARLESMFPGRNFEEVCAESWPWQTAEQEAADEMFSSWRQSRGHWAYVSSRHAVWAYAMARGSNGIWYGVGLFGD